MAVYWRSLRTSSYCRNGVFFLLQRKRKALSYEVITRTPLLSIKDEVKGRVQILLDDTPVTNAYMIVLEVINAGNVPIVPSDYIHSVRFGFGDTAQILSVEVTETNPDNIEASAEVDNTSVVLERVLLNSNDSITLKVLLAQFDGEIEVDGRIVGVKHIKPARETGVYNVVAWMSLGISLSIVGVVSVVFDNLWGAYMAIVGYTLMFFGPLTVPSYRRLFRRRIRGILGSD